MSNAELKERVRAFWQAHPCGTKFADAEPGTRRFYELVEEHRYEKEWHIPLAADFSSARGLKVLEIGCGLGTDGVQFARAGADYTGVDLTEAAVELTRKNFELFNLPGTFRTADAENLDLNDNSFDLVYSHGVLHHTPDTARAVREIHRVLRPGGRFTYTTWHGPSSGGTLIGLMLKTFQRLANMDVGLPPAPPIFQFAEAETRDRVSVASDL